MHRHFGENHHAQYVGLGRPCRLRGRQGLRRVASGRQPPRGEVDNPTKDGPPAKITISVGCATYPGDVGAAARGEAGRDENAEAEEIVAVADRNLYRAKANGKNQVWAGAEHQPSQTSA